MDNNDWQDEERRAKAYAQQPARDSLRNIARLMDETAPARELEELSESQRFALLYAYDRNSKMLVGGRGNISRNVARALERRKLAYRVGDGFERADDLYCLTADGVSLGFRLDAQRAAKAR